MKTMKLFGKKERILDGTMKVERNPVEKTLFDEDHICPLVLLSQNVHQNLFEQNVEQRALMLERVLHHL